MTAKEFARKVAEASGATGKVLRGQWPILSVGVFFVVAFALVIGGYWRRGALVMAIGVGLAAVMRLLLADDRAGLLVVRSRIIDVATTASVSAVMLYVAWTINPLGTA